MRSYSGCFAYIIFNISIGEINDMHGDGSFTHWSLKQWRHNCWCPWQLVNFDTMFTEFSLWCDSRKFNIVLNNGLALHRRRAVIWTNQDFVERLIDTAQVWAVFKGSNMIVCVLLVSNSRGCCLAAPGDHESAARDQSCLIPIITWWHHFFPQQPIFCSLKAFLGLNREQPQSPLPCHHVISVASIGVASTPGRENARDSFCGRLGV